MNKNVIKKFAMEARRELISRVGQRALKYGISDKEAGNPNDDNVGGYLLSSTEKKQRTDLIAQIKEKGYEQVMEEVAYTWFNRFSALRFMEVNGYLPTRVRVFTDENNAFKPQILTEAIHMELDGLDMEKVYAYKEANDNDELYKYLLITQCNALNSVLPGMFQKIADYTELLFPDNLLREGSVVQKMIDLIDEEDWKDAVQIIGWLYQYYNSEKKDNVFAALKKNVKITKENIPAATQLFTPDWIVRYMVENSLGRLWVEGHPNDELKSQWKYYLEEAEQETDVQAQLASIREEYKALKPEDVLCIDPCCGSGHILAYMFDVLVQIYEAYGVDTRTAVASIVENNIYGLDIDDRAAQLAYFSVMMKACQYDKRFLRRKVQPHVYAIAESNHMDQYAVEYFCNGDAKLKEAMDTIIEELHDAKEYGSIITVSQQDWDALYARFDEIQNETMMSIYSDCALKLREIVCVAKVLSGKYQTVVTNPPYMGLRSLSRTLFDYTTKNYSLTKNDLYGVFMQRCLDGFAASNMPVAMITQHVWMFTSGFEKYREQLYKNATITSMIHLGTRAFEEISGEVVQTCTFVVRKNKLQDYMATYVRLVDYQNAFTKEDLYLRGEDRYFCNVNNFLSVPGNPVCYWLSEQIINAFKKYPLIADISRTRQGLKTSDDKRFIRFIFEVDYTKVAPFYSNVEEAAKSDKKWFWLNKGGQIKWYGNNIYLINWENDGKEVKDYASQIAGSYSKNITAIDAYFKSCISWPQISISKPSFRVIPRGYIFASAGPSLFVNDDKNKWYVLGLLNSSITQTILDAINPTINFGVSDILKIPFIYREDQVNQVSELVKKCVALCTDDWNLFEESWGFATHALIIYRTEFGDVDVPMDSGQYRIADAYNRWERNAAAQFDSLKKNEEELNRIFIDIYGLQDELTPEVEDKDVTVCKADLERDIKSFISYAVGCMFGRYSLDVEGLVYAGGEWVASKYSTFAADKDNIIPISNDEYFEDDIVGRFVKFVEVVYGKETLQENLKFIADALGGNGQPKDVIRSYFINGFYTDHCKMYQKRPIYWMFDSGKKNGFKCLIYMHRYQPDTIARIRTDYVHEQQARYRTSIADLETRIANASTSERVKLNKQLKKLNDQATEIHDYEEKIHHLADQMISINLDDGVKKNYEIFKDVLAKIK